MSETQLRNVIGAVRDPHLPFGIAELGMLEEVSLNSKGELRVVVNVPCHHCPGLQMLRDDIESSLSSVGFTKTIDISFHGARSWSPGDMSERARKAMSAMGVQVKFA